MRTIDITNETNLELWPGRRLYTAKDSLLVSLPRGCVYRAAPRSLSFGSATRTSVIVNGTEAQIGALFTMIVEAERPEAAVKL